VAEDQPDHTDADHTRDRVIYKCAGTAADTHILTGGLRETRCSKPAGLMPRYRSMAAASRSLETVILTMVLIFDVWIDGSPVQKVDLRSTHGAGKNTNNNTN
jgi:hypothetical protein